jgi:hypothetical protein
MWFMPSYLYRMSLRSTLFNLAPLTYMGRRPVRSPNRMLKLEAAWGRLVSIFGIIATMTLFAFVPVLNHFGIDDFDLSKRRYF